MLDVSVWAGMADIRGAATPPLTVTGIAERDNPNHSGSGAWQGLVGTSRYWIKVSNNPQGGRILVNEYVVNRVGLLIGAPVCDVSLVAIPPELAGEALRGFTLSEGIGVGSLDIPGVVEQRALLHRERDDNRRRHAGVYALHDLCWGEDVQWLYCADDDNTLYSHDHGHFLPGGPNWTSEQLLANVDVPHTQGVDPAGLDAGALEEAADRIGGVTRDAIAGILKGVPESWPATSADLEHLGWFLERRAPQVAIRLRELATAVRRDA